MSFNNRNFNPNVWDAPRTNNPPPFANNFNSPFSNNFQPNSNQNRPNFFQGPPPMPPNHGNPHMRMTAPFGDERQNFRKFNGPDYRNNNSQRGNHGNRNFQNNPPPRWKNNDSRPTDSAENSNDRTSSKSPASGGEDTRSIVEQLKIKAAKMTKQQESSGSSEIDATAKTASRKLLNEMKTSDIKGDIKDLINNPKQPHVKAAITYHALEKLRRGMRKQLKDLGGAEEDTDFLDAQEAVDLKDIPQTLIAQMGHELGVADMDLSNFEENIDDDKEMAVVENNLGNDFLFSSEQLLMTSSLLLGENESETDLPPPLPSDPVIKPPEPVPPPVHEAVYSSTNVPWQQTKKPVVNQNRFIEEDWDIDSAKNPDPPSTAKSNNVTIKTQPIPVICSNRENVEKPPPKIKAEPVPLLELKLTEPLGTPLRDELPSATPRAQEKENSETTNGQQSNPLAAACETPAQEQTVVEQDQPVERKANETYGDYIRRKNNSNSNLNKRPQNNRDNEDSWMSNNRRNNNDRMSRNDQNRQRDKNNFSRRRSESRDRNDFWNNDKGSRDNSKDMKDGFNYRFDASKDGSIDRLNSIIQPKTQFKGSFNKNRMGPRDFKNRNRSRERTPTNTEGEFGDLLTMQSSSKDTRPCYHMLKKCIDIDTEMTQIHDKIHGIDKVIQNLQSERVTLQKKYSQLQHDRKVIFDNLLKRSQFNEADRRSESHDHVREKSPVQSQKQNASKKLQSMVEQRKRKSDPEPAPVEEPPKKKKFVPMEEAKSAAQKQKEKEEKELKERLEKIRRQKQLRREREEAERRRLEEEALKHEKIIKLEKSNKSQKQVQIKTEKGSAVTFDSSEFLNVANYQLKIPKVALFRTPVPQNILDLYSAARFPQIPKEEWSKWTTQKGESEVQVIEGEKDPLAIDENPSNPPTPGNNLGHDENSLEEATINYDEWSGNFNSHDSPIVYLQNIDGRHMICAAEDGKLFKYRLANGRVDAIFDHHSQICNAFLYDQKQNIVYTASSDTNVYRVKFDSFQANGSRSFNESLQVIEQLRSTIYVGAKSGNIYKMKLDLTNEDDDDTNEPLCCVEGLILCLKASKEGARSIILVASRGKAIQVRDAGTGLLLRTLADEMSGVSVYDMALDGSTIYCGCNLNDIFAIDFTNGALLKKRKMLGAGAICVKIYKELLIAACYDGNIYIFNNSSDDEGAVNITGPSNMLLTMDLWENKIIASTKDKTVKIMNIPT